MLISELILFKNNRYIVFNKPAGIPVVPDLTKDASVTGILAAYVKHDVQAVHRIDRVASGLVIIAQNSDAMRMLSEKFAVGEIEKTYLAVVKNPMPEESGTLVHYIKKVSGKGGVKAFLAPTSAAKEAQLSYRVIGKSDHYQFLEIQLHTGRQHQIRAQLAAVGSPIKGDQKYGFNRQNEDRSIHLHAWKLRFTDPVSGEQMAFEAPIRQDDPLWKFLSDQLNPPV